MDWVMSTRIILRDLPPMMREQAVKQLAIVSVRTVRMGGRSFKDEAKQASAEERKALATRKDRYNWPGRLLFEIRCAGLPKPDLEFMFMYPMRKWRFDMAWPDKRLACEVEGITPEGGRHQRMRGYSEDCAKYSEAAIRHWRVIRVTSMMIKRGVALDMLERAFG